ncbi:MAG: hypothetical protein ACE37F_13675 [Nannocystaceae bacterium]|nr:hypothetical protein [bacterium]
MSQLATTSRPATAEFTCILPVRQLMEDPGVELVRRAADASWFYAGAIPQALGGWNLYRPEIYMPHGSALAQWLENPAMCLREANEGDRLMYELLFAAHDYLHAWSLQEIASLAPKLGVGTTAIDEASLEDLAFVQLVTEAAATVGLDYWYLSCIDLTEMLDLGSTIQSLTISYRETHASEYRRFNPDFAVQDPAFFTSIAEFYCTGRFPGFDVASLRRSPRMLRWLRHELSYGQLQRRYTRMWLRHLGGLRTHVTVEQLQAPVQVDSPWKRELLGELGQRLWEKIKNDSPSRRRMGNALGETSWRAPEDGPLDFRFTNFNALDEDPWSEISRRGIVRDSFSKLVDQVASAHRYDRAPKSLLRALGHVRESNSVELLRHVFDHLERLPAEGSEPRDLFLMS